MKKSAPARLLKRSDGARYLAGAKAARADANGLVRSVVIYADLSDVGLPRSRSLALGVRHVVTESDALTADTAFCHEKHLHIYGINTLPNHERRYYII